MLYRRMHKKGISEVRKRWPPYHQTHSACGDSSRSSATFESCTTSTRCEILRWLTWSLLQEVAKKRTRRTVKHQRAIVGASLDVIKERRTQRPEARSAARQAAINEGKERKAAAESKKKAEKAKTAANAARGQVRGGIASKQQAKGAPAKVSAKSR
jgi:hypothetical protein